MNPPCGGSENGVRHVTRFIAFGRVGNPDKKNKWISAYNVTPVRTTSPALNTYLVPRVCILFLPLPSQPCMSSDLLSFWSLLRLFSGGVAFS